jgi:hypothetical protein
MPRFRVSSPRALALLLAGLVAAAPALALDGWLRSRDAGLDAAQKSGKPLLVVTIWPDRV